MAIPACQAEVAAFLEQLAGAKPRETHISAVFLGAHEAWKLKKAVRLSFLDFTTLDERERKLRRELELNRPAAPFYRDVAAVVRRAGGLALDPDAHEGALDFVLRMARVPEGDFFEVIAAEGRLTPELLLATADTIAAYHAALAPVPGTDPVAAMRGVTTGNAVAAHAAGLDAGQVDRWAAAALARLAALAPWLTARGRGGFVRRAHGDLHLGNLCLWEGRPVPFDALEFDEAMATIDLAYDLAFLLMDLDRRTSRADANLVLNRYVARGGDDALVAGLPLFLSLRAMVRAHVRRASGADGAEDYLRAAQDYLAPPPPLVLAIGGLQGTGKSTLARALAPALGPAPGALVLRSDEIRKRLHGVAPERRLPESAYSAPANAALNAELLAATGRCAAAGHAVVADATFLDPAQRTALAEMAARAGVRFLGIWLEAKLPVLEARILARHGDASDADVAVLRAAAAHDPGAGDWLAVPAADGAVAQARIEAAIGAMGGA